MPSCQAMREVAGSWGGLVIADADLDRSSAAAVQHSSSTASGKPQQTYNRRAHYAAAVWDCEPLQPPGPPTQASYQPHPPGIVQRKLCPTKQNPCCLACPPAHLLRARHLPVPPHMSQGVAPVPAHSRQVLASISAFALLAPGPAVVAAAAAAAPVKTSSWRREETSGGGGGRACCCCSPASPCAAARGVTAWHRACRRAGWACRSGKGTGGARSPHWRHWMRLPLSAK